MLAAQTTNLRACSTNLCAETTALCAQTTALCACSTDLCTQTTTVCAQPTDLRAQGMALRAYSTCLCPQTMDLYAWSVKVCTPLAFSLFHGLVKSCLCRWRLIHHVIRICQYDGLPRPSRLYRPRPALIVTRSVSEDVTRCLAYASGFYEMCHGRGRYNGWPWKRQPTRPRNVRYWARRRQFAGSANTLYPSQAAGRNLRLLVATCERIAVRGGTRSHSLNRHWQVTKGVILK